MFYIPVCNTKEKSEFEFHPDAPTLEFFLNSNICSFSSFSSAFIVSGEFVAAGVNVRRIGSLFSYQSHGCTDRIKFPNAIFIEK